MKIWISVIACFIPFGAMAADLEERVSARLALDRGASAKSGQGSVTYGVGVSHDRDEDDFEVSSVPMYLVYRSPSALWWQFYAGTEGYTRLRGPGFESAIGISDLSLSLTRKFSSSILGTVSALVPTHGDAGSSAGAQSLRLSYVTDLHPGLRASVRGTVGRSDARIDGVSSVSQSLYGSLNFSRGETQSLDLWASRSHRRGAMGRTELGADLGWALSPQAWGTLSVFHGATSGARHTGLAVDVSFSY